MPWHVLSSKILMLNKLEKGRTEIGKSGGNSFKGKTVRVVVKSTDWESKGQGSVSSCGISDKPLYSLSLVFSSI